MYNILHSGEDPVTLARRYEAEFWEVGQVVRTNSVGVVGSRALLLATPHRSMETSHLTVAHSIPKTYQLTQDMRALNVEPPDAVARVTEHMDAIVDYIAGIERNGLAYRTRGSGVYFDVGAFAKRYVVHTCTFVHTRFDFD